MTSKLSNREVLIKAVEEAIKNGWDVPYDAQMVVSTFGMLEIIYDHDFAKALWGSDEQDRQPVGFGGDEDDYSCNIFISDWQYHLQQMVISEDPITYLGDNI